METNNISIRHLRAFVEVANSGSFTRAASHLNLTQSTLTATIKQLEQQVDLTLFDRTTRRVILTAAGEQFQPVALRLISDFDTAITDLKSIAGYRSGRVGIAASPSMLTRLLPVAIAEFHRQHRDIQLYLRDDGAGGIEQRVLDNDVDFGIAGNHSNDPEIEYTPLLRDQYGVVGHPNFISGDLSQWQQLEGHTMLYLTEDTGIRAQLAKLQQQSGFSLGVQTPQIEVSNPAGLAALLDQQLGLSILPSLAAGTSAFSELAFEPLQQPQLFRDIYLLTRKGRTLSPAALKARNVIVQHFAGADLPPYVHFTGTIVS